MVKWLHPTDIVGTNYLSLPLIHVPTSDTKLLTYTTLLFKTILKQLPDTQEMARSTSDHSSFRPEGTLAEVQQWKQLKNAPSTSQFIHIKNHPWNWIHRYWNWFHGYWCTPMPIRNESINPVSAVRKLGASKRIFIRRNAKYKACSHWQTLCHHRDSLNGNEYLY